MFIESVYSVFCNLGAAFFGVINDDDDNLLSGGKS